MESFELKPKVLVGADMTITSSPDTKHYLTHDLYTHITALPQPKVAPSADVQAAAAHGDNENDDKNYDPPVDHEVAVGDTIRYREGYIVLKGLIKEKALENIPLTSADIAIGAPIGNYR